MVLKFSKGIKCESKKMGYDMSCWSCKVSQQFENRVPVPNLNQVQVLKLEVSKDRLKLSTQTQAIPLDKGPVVKSLPVISIKFTRLIITVC